MAKNTISSDNVIIASICGAIASRASFYDVIQMAKMVSKKADLDNEIKNLEMNLEKEKSL